MKILIDNGHGSDTPGKRSPDGRFLEYKFNREIARLIVLDLQDRGYDAELLVPEETDIPLKERTNRVNSHCATLGKENVILVSIHVNATCLAENGFMDSRESLAYISSRTGKQAIVDLHVEGIIEYLQGNI